MKQFKKISAIFEQGPPDPAKFNAAPTTKPADPVTKGSGTGADPVPAAAPTAPDPAVMAKLLKMPNSRENTMHNQNETKPTVNNGVSVVVKGTGRSYNFRSTPLNMVAYIENVQTGDNVAYRGTYTITDTEITTKSTDGKISETITIATSKIAIDPTTKQPKSNLPSNESSADKEKNVAATVAAAIKANSNYWSNSNEEVVHNATEAAFYWIIKNKLTPDQAKKFILTAFSKDGSFDLFTTDASTTYAEMDAWTWGDFGYAPFSGAKPAGRVMSRATDWKVDWASEGDEDTKYLQSKVPSSNPLASYEPSGDEAKKWAETVWSIIDDTWVSADEEVNAIMAILALTPKGILNVDAAWSELQNLGIIDTKLGIDAAIADEVDSPEAGKIVQLFAAALRGTPSEGAKKMLELA